MQKVKPQRKNSQISHGTCGHGLLDSCRKYSTNRPIFMQNKANLLKDKINAKFFNTRDYENAQLR